MRNPTYESVIDMGITYWGDIGEEEVRPGIFRQEFSTGTLQVIKYRYAPGSRYPSHSHPEEQMTILLEGELHFSMANERVLCRPGALLSIPGGTEHSAENRGTDEATTLNLFTPPKRV